MAKKLENYLFFGCTFTVHTVVASRPAPGVCFKFVPPPPVKIIRFQLIKFCFLPRFTYMFCSYKSGLKEVFTNIANISYEIYKACWFTFFNMLYSIKDSGARCSMKISLPVRPYVRSSILSKWQIGLWAAIFSRSTCYVKDDKYFNWKDILSQLSWLS